MLHVFGRFFFPHIVKGDYETPEAHLDLISELSKRCDSAIVFPRGFAKSTWEKIDTIHDIVYKLEPVILYVGATLGDAGHHFESIKAELENNEALRDTYGDHVPAGSMIGRKWTNRHIQTRNGVNLVARGRARGRGVNIKNRRPTKVVIDDVEDDDQVKSPYQREKLHRWLTDVIFPSVDAETGFVKMIGTVLHEASELLTFYNKHGGIFRRGIEDGKSIWPEYWPMEKLEKKREQIGTRAFAKEIMNDPMSNENASIKTEWIDQALFSDIPDDGRYAAVIYIDPQAGESRLADEYAITALFAQIGTRHRYVHEQVAGRDTVLEQAKQLVRMWVRNKSKVRAVGIEKVLNQTSLWQVMADWKAKKINLNTDATQPFARIPEDDRNIPIVERSPKGKDKLSRLQAFEPDFERGEIHLRPEMEELKNQVMFLGQGTLEHDDRVDSLVGALEMSYDYGVERKAAPRKADDEDGRGERGTVMGNLWNRKF